MARKLNEFPTGLKPERPTLYPWNDWLNGEVWELAQGEDFKVTADSLRTQARVNANKKGGHIQATIFNNKRSLIIQFVPGPANKDEADAAE